MKYYIFGSGFGLYGYIPAILAKKKNKVILKKKYYNFFCSRKDLLTYRNKIKWTNDASVNVDALVIAKRPVDQYKICKNIKKVKRLFLEKPLAQNPKLSEKLTVFFKKKKINYSIAYLFLYTDWYRKIYKILKKNNKYKKFKLEWKFNSTNSAKSWKNNVRLGGGIINFYGIHLLAVLASLNFKICNYSRIYLKKRKQIKWIASFKKKTGHEVALMININSKYENFKISSETKKNNFLIVNQQNPMAKKRFGIKDYRINLLKKYINNSNLTNRKKIIYSNTIKLWKSVIKKTINKNINYD